jgi:predicted lipoprotein
MDCDSPCRDSHPAGKRQPITGSKYRIVSEVLAEGWAKAVMDWHQRNQLPFHLVSQPNDAPSFGFHPTSPAADAM